MLAQLVLISRKMTAHSEVVVVLMRSCSLELAAVIGGMSAAGGKSTNFIELN